MGGLSFPGLKVSDRGQCSQPGNDRLGELGGGGGAADVGGDHLALGHLGLDGVVQPVGGAGLARSFSIMAKAIRMADGLARFLPAMSGAEPWTAS